MLPQYLTSIKPRIQRPVFKAERATHGRPLTHTLYTLIQYEGESSQQVREGQYAACKQYFDDSPNLHKYCTEITVPWNHMCPGYENNKTNKNNFWYGKETMQTFDVIKWPDYFGTANHREEYNIEIRKFSCLFWYAIFEWILYILRYFTGINGCEMEAEVYHLLFLCTYSKLFSRWPFISSRTAEWHHWKHRLCSFTWYVHGMCVTKTPE